MNNIIDNLRCVLQLSAVKENGILRGLVEDAIRKEEDSGMTRGGDGSHWDGCESVHWDCKISKLEARVAELEANKVRAMPDDVFQELVASMKDGAEILYSAGYEWYSKEPDHCMDIMLLLDDGTEARGYYSDVSYDYWKYVDIGEERRCYPVAWRELR
jgi:hypothetical protein